jgi:hypothetical protein
VARPRHLSPAVADPFVPSYRTVRYSAWALAAPPEPIVLGERPPGELPRDISQGFRLTTAARSIQLTVSPFR